jgi:thiamine transport system ATP-binding protein
VARLSGGEQQRVALARALAPRPRLLMLDEPMGSLDRSLRERLPDELRDIFTTLGLTVIYVTHDHDEALSVADRVVLLHDGRIVADDLPERLWTAPPSAWAATFLGLRNVAAGVVADAALETPWGRLPLPEDVPPAPAGRHVTVVVKPGGLTPAPEGVIGGTVTGRRFRGDHVLLSVATGPGASLSVEARRGWLPALGDRVRLALDAEAVHVIDEAGALPSAHDR